MMMQDMGRIQCPERTHAMHKPLSRSVTLAAFLALCAPAGAQQGGKAAGAGGGTNHPLNLSLPDMNSAGARNPGRGQGMHGQDGSGSMPYGAGYEARQRSSGGGSGGLGGFRRTTAFGALRVQ
ncbi:MAG: hypothetical protein OHM77_09085 [Candidatus Nitricoxidivorans perseverans]|uniref:Uncharacterized protein n=1 Tax=Candidatus Nitricoxidivorans perseverans TaxID=2975601 RepID=A0AA49FJQ1_9PROT|nr:MAG: hypothetical protein OHM77_09085 [Candidatus Nitricoxidivorans perseverans]